MLMDPHVSKLLNGQEERNSGDKMEGKKSCSLLGVPMFYLSPGDPWDGINKSIFQFIVATATVVEIIALLWTLMAFPGPLSSSRHHAKICTNCMIFALFPCSISCCFMQSAECRFAGIHAWVEKQGLGYLLLPIPSRTAGHGVKTMKVLTWDTSGIQEYWVSHWRLELVWSDSPNWFFQAARCGDTLCFK